ncbi:MAG: ABC transporter ATP-binding protein [Patescibacteria group bacterium]
MKKNFSALGQIWFIIKFSAGFLWKADKKAFLSSVISNAASSTVIIPNVLLDKAFLDTIIANVKTPDPSSAIRTIGLILVGKALLFSFETVARRTSGYYTRILHWRKNQLAEIMIGEKYARVGVPTIEDPKFKDIYQRVQSDSISQLTKITDNFISSPRHISGILSSLSIFLTQPLIIIISLVSLLPTVIVERVFIKKGYELDKVLAPLLKKRGFYSSYLSRPRSYMEGRLLNVSQYLSQKVSEFWEEIISKRRVQSQSRRKWAMGASILDEIIALSLNGFFALKAILGQITVGSAQAYVRAVSSFKSHSFSLIGAFLELYESHFYLTDLVWFLGLEEPYFSGKGVRLKEKPIAIKFDDVWFKYPGSDNWILKGVSFDINPGQNVAIVGKNGAGKTTLVKLLCGFYEPTKGVISINGDEVSRLNKEEYWKKVSVLFQDYEGYSMSVRESIGMSNISQIANLKQIEKYAKMVDLDSWINSLDLKYETPLSRDFEKGVVPSSGQWQRLGLARSLFKDCEVLILDEPTSNVDPVAEENIFHEILKLGKNKIIMFISHRFSTVRRADRIIVMDNGVVVEQGIHVDLMKQKGEYAKLFTLQAKSYK